MPLRIGVLGAAHIVPGALLVPAREDPEVEVVALASRDQARARLFADQHGIPRVLGSYDELLADPDVDAVYNPLPNGLHGRWTLAALAAGKHVLCEKPFTANAEEAEQVAAAARESGLVVMEAFHYRYHALTERMLDLLASGRLGRVRRIDTWFRVRLRDPGDIRWDLPLAGGATMDIGCYPVHLLRTLAGRVAGGEPTVLSATAQERSPGVDRALRAELSLPGGATGSVSGAMLARRPRTSGARVVGTAGTMGVTGFVAPQSGHRLVVRDRSGRRAGGVARAPSSYAAQLRAFADAVLRGASFPTGVDDAVANMRVIDACYAAAGLPRREPTIAA